MSKNYLYIEKECKKWKIVRLHGDVYG